MTVLYPESVNQDTRRSLTQLLTADIQQINVYEAKIGSILGDHFHKSTTEYFYILSGTLIYNNGSIVEPDTLFVVYPEERHTLTCLTDAKFMTFLTKAYDEEKPDLWKK